MDVIEKRIRQRMSKYSDTFTIGGGMDAKKSFKSIAESGKMGDVLNDLTEVYREIDSEYGTKLVEGMAINFYEGAGDNILKELQNLRIN